MKPPTKPSVILRGLSLLTAGLAACEKKPEYPVIEPFPTTVWARPLCEGLQIRIANDGSGDLLLMSPSTSSDVRQKMRLRSMKNLPIYRYDSKTKRLSFDVSDSWSENEGPTAISGKQHDLPPFGEEFTHDLGGHTLQWHGPVPTAAPTVLAAVRSPNEKYVASLSAEGKSKTDGIVPFSDPTVPGRRFHEVFRASDASKVGTPVILANTTDQNNVLPCWSPDNRFVVYNDGKCEHLWIIEAPITPSEAKSK